MLAAGLSYRESGPADGPVALLLHGYPESSFMWAEVIPHLADAGWRAIAPDFAGFGDSPPDPPGTWERHVESLERFRARARHRALRAGRPRLGRPDRNALGLRAPGGRGGARDQLDGLLPGRKVARHGAGATGATHRRADDRGDRPRHVRERDAPVDAGVSDEALGEYWKAYADATRRTGQLELYRSGDFSRLEQYDLAAGGAGAARVGRARRVRPRGRRPPLRAELPDTELVVKDGKGTSSGTRRSANAPRR